MIAHSARETGAVHKGEDRGRWTFPGSGPAQNQRGRKPYDPVEDSEGDGFHWDNGGQYSTDPVTGIDRACAGSGNRAGRTSIVNFTQKQSLVFSVFNL